MRETPDLFPPEAYKFRVEDVPDQNHVKLTCCVVIREEQCINREYLYLHPQRIADAEIELKDAFKKRVESLLMDRLLLTLGTDMPHLQRALIEIRNRDYPNS